jgi:hypothetical protein
MQVKLGYRIGEKERVGLWERRGGSEERSLE